MEQEETGFETGAEERLGTGDLEELTSCFPSTTSANTGIWLFLRVGGFA